MDYFDDEERASPRVACATLIVAVTLSWAVVLGIIAIILRLIGR